MKSLEPVFAPGGALAAAIPGYRERRGQVELADAIAEAIRSTGVLIAEAGTGTGKTFAYLVPALLAGGKVIVSTGTKTLQDQLFDRDLPAVRSALASGASAALLKGRANYVCLYRMKRAGSEGRFASREEIAQLQKIERFAATSVTGDRADLAEVPEDAPVWSQATSTRDNCLGAKCEHYDDCFVMRARRAAQEAEIVVVINHHLFFADVVLRDEGVSELLPACNTVIFDEAHQLPETARLFFGDTLSTSQVIELARDSRVELRAAGGASPELEALLNRVEKASRDLRIALGDTPVRYAWPQALRLQGFPEALTKLRSAVKMLDHALASQQERSEGLAACARRAGNAYTVLTRLMETDANEDVRWAEVFGQSVQLHVTPLHSGELFRRQMDDHPRAWIFTSATLAVGEDFGHFTRELGVEAARTARRESPFQFREQALLYLPKGLPEPSDPAFTDAVIEAAFPVLQASGGRAFLLFTTLRALRRAHELLRGRIEFPLLVQGTGSRSDLLARFRKLGNAVLLGSASFWEGVDVRGEPLSLVVIDKLPFAPPDDPVLAARIDSMKSAGRNPFNELQVPQAVLQLKQGAGRLIRDEADRGVLMLCDPRLTSRAYGRRILESLPPMPLTRDLARVEQFFRARPGDGSG